MSGSSTSTTPPPPSPDFSLVVPASVQLQAGGVPAQWKLEVFLDGGPENVTLSIPNLPAGVAVSPSSPVTVSANEEVEFLVYAQSSAAVGSGTITVSGTNGSITHTYPVPLTVTGAAPFQLEFSPSTLMIPAGASGQVQATVMNQPSGTNISFQAITTPQFQGLDFPKITTSGANGYTLTFSADYASPPLADFPVFVTAQSSSGDTSTAILPVTVTASSTTAVDPSANRSTVIRTDEEPTDVVYDQARKLLFLAIPGLNQVRVLSSVDFHTVATIPVPQNEGLGSNAIDWGTLDESADGSAVYVGGPGEITTINPSTLQVTGFTAVPQGANILPGGGVAIGVTKLVTLSTGKVLVLNQNTGLLFLWDPATGSMTSNDAQNMKGAISMIRSANHNIVLIFGGTFSSFDALYDANSGSFITEQRFPGTSYSTQNDGDIPSVALSPDGSQIAAVGTSNGISIYDDSFSPLAIQPAPAGGLQGLPIYSLDGSTLDVFGVLGYLAEDVAFNTTTYQPEGLFALNSWFTVGIPFAIDETGMIYGALNDAATGQALIATDADRPGAIQEEGSAISPSLIFPDVLTVPGGSLQNTVPTSIQGASFDSSQNYEVYVGAAPASSTTQIATGVTVASSSALNFTIPQGKIEGPANVTVARPDGWFSIIADGLSFGPTILGVSPNTLAPTGPTQTTVIGYDFKNTQVTVGSSAISNASGVLLENNGGNLYPFQQMTIQVPSGSPGNADLTVANIGGSTTLTSGIHYLESQAVYPVTGFVSGMVYDQPRQRLYLANSANNEVDIFDLTARAFDAPIAVGNGPKGLTLTADGTKLAVLNATDGTVSVIDPSQEKVIATYPVLSQAELSLYSVSAITQVTPHDALVVLRGHGLRLLNLDTGSLSCAGVAGCDVTGTNINPGFGPVAVTSAPDGTKVFITDGNSQVALLNVSANTLTAKVGATSPGGIAATNEDGSEFAANLSAYDGQLDYLNTMGNDIFFLGTTLDSVSTTGVQFNASGSLLFVAGTSYIDVYDVHTSRVVMQIGEPNDVNYGHALALDETGTKIFSADQNGLVISQLAEAPLSVASVSPNSGSGGTTVTIRGSGFESGTVVKFGSIQVSASYVDSMTMTAAVPALPTGAVQLTVSNPDGTQYSYDAAFQVN